MQSGGQGAGIQLQVGLDLTYFRNQLPRLGTTAAGYQLPLNIKFDRKRIADEYRLLNRYISGKTFDVKIDCLQKLRIFKNASRNCKMSKLTWQLEQFRVYRRKTPGKLSLDCVQRSWENPRRFLFRPPSFQASLKKMSARSSQ